MGKDFNDIKDSLEEVITDLEETGGKNLKVTTLTKHDNPTGCKMCGLCCKAIPLFCSEEMIERGHGEDAEWIKEYWKRITPEEAFNINPHLEYVANKYHGDGYGHLPLYFTCTLLVDNKCSKHDMRPPVCRNYPWYASGRVTGDGLIGGKLCGFAKKG